MSCTKYFLENIPHTHRSLRFALLMGYVHPCPFTTMLVSQVIFTVGLCCGGRVNYLHFEHQVVKSEEDEVAYSDDLILVSL